MFYHSHIPFPSKFDCMRNAACYISNFLKLMHEDKQKCKFNQIKMSGSIFRLNCTGLAGLHNFVIRDTESFMA
jgi:hypothetical protein